MAIRVLALDTSTLTASVAVAAVDTAGARVLAEGAATSTTHSEGLLLQAKAALEQASVAARDLDAIVCGEGPGSFTGLRIGLATAKGLALASGARLLLASSLAALALDGPARGLIVSTIDARKHELYAGFYLRAGDELRAAAPEAVMAPEGLAAQVAAIEAPGGVVTVVGEGGKVYAERLGALAVAFDESWRLTPGAAALVRLCRSRLLAGEADDLASSAPRYLRAPDAELPSAGHGGSFHPSAIAHPVRRASSRRRRRT